MYPLITWYVSFVIIVDLIYRHAVSDTLLYNICSILKRNRYALTGLETHLKTNTTNAH